MATDKDPYNLLDKCQLQILKVTDQLTSDLEMGPKDRIAVVIQVERAIEGLQRLRKDDVPVAGSAARKFEQAFAAKNAGDRDREHPGRTGDSTNGNSEPDPDDPDSFWRTPV
jgi:hypothetical protein